MVSMMQGFNAISIYGIIIGIVVLATIGCWVFYEFWGWYLKKWFKDEDK